MDLNEYVALVQRVGQKPRCLYHFTDIRNLPSIRARGLLSMREMRRQSISPEAPGGNEQSLEVDVRTGMDAYVHLCMLSEHPMEFRAKERGQINETKFLEIDPSIVLTANVLACDGVSIKSGVDVEPLDQVLDRLDLEVIYHRTDWKNAEVRARRLAAKKYEVLIPDAIPLRYILNLR